MLTLIQRLRTKKAEIPNHIESGQNQQGVPFRLSGGVQRPGQGSGCRSLEGTACAKQEGMWRWCRAGWRQRTGEFRPRACSQLRERPRTHKVWWARQGLGISSVGLGCLLLYSWKGVPKQPGGREFQCGTAFRAGTWFPDCQSGPTAHRHTLGSEPPPSRPGESQASPEPP